MRKFTNFALLLLLVSNALCPYAAFAQATPIRDPLREALARKYQLPPDSPLIEASLERFRNPPPEPKPRPDLPVVRHLRGTEGSAFTSAAELEAQDQRLRDANTAKYQELLKEEQVQKITQQAVDRLIKPPPITAKPPDLPSCPKDITVATLLADPTKTSRIERSERVVADMLFIKGPVPMDPDLAFGRNTSVVQYKTTPGDPFSLIAANEGIQCLPYRIRITNKHSVHDMGLNALKNYDNHPKGELYEGIKARLNVYR